MGNHRRRPICRMLLLGGFAVAMAASEVASAKVYTVGAYGAYSTLESALAAAAGDPGVAEVRLAEGIYQEFNLLASVAVGRELVIEGGWDPRFFRRKDDPETTILDARGMGKVLRIQLYRSKVTVRGLTFQGSLASKAYPDGALVVAGEQGEALVERCVFVANRHVVDTSLETSGAALTMFLTSGQANFRVLRNVFRENRVEVTDGAAVGAALWVFFPEGSIEVSGNAIEKNVAKSGFVTQSYAAAIQTWSGAIVFEDNVVFANASLGAWFNANWRSQGAVTLFAIEPGGTIEARRNVFLRNRSSSNDGSQWSVIAFAGATATLSDSLVAASPDAGGLEIWADGEVNVVNCTLADNGRGDVWVDYASIGKVSISNSILASSLGGGYSIQANGVAVAQSKNIVGVAPSFVDAARGDYRLRPTSPAIDFGDHTPPGGLGPLDLDHAPRVLGTRVDVGAYEFY